MDTNTPTLSDSLTSAAQALGQKTKTVIDYAAANPKAIAWNTGIISVVYLTARVAGFKAGFEFAKKTT